MTSEHPITRQCPFCAEEIKWEAVKCKHCGEDLSKLHIKERKAAGKKRDQKIILIVFLAFMAVVLLVIVPSFAILLFIIGGISWFLHKHPNARAKLAQSTKKGNKKMWLLLWSYIMKYKLQIGVIVILLLVARGVYGMFASTTPVITLKDHYDFSGNEADIMGQVKTDCRCTLEVTLNDKPITLQKDGTFSINLPVATTDNTGKIEVKATSKPLHLSSTLRVATANSSYNRQPTSIDVISPPAQWNTTKLTLALHGSPNAVVTVKESPSVKIVLDAKGDGNAVVPFSTLYNAETNSFTIIAKADGYAEGTKQLTVKNQKYDSVRVAKEQDAKKLKEMAQQAKDAMESYSGNGNVQLAVNSDINENKCLSYSCVNSGWKYISVWATVRNAGQGVVNVNPNDFTLQDTDGQTFTYDTATFTYQHPFDAVALQPGGNTAGMLVFIVPNDSKVFTLLYAGFNGSVAKPILIQ